MRIRKDTLLPLLLAIAAGGIAWFLVGQATRTSRVVVAARDIEPMDRVESSSVKIVDLPVAAVHNKAFKRVEDVVGKRALGPIPAGQQITSSQVAAPAQGLGRWTQGGAVVMFVPIPPERWVGGAVHAGDVVDLIFCSSEQKTGASIARLVLTGVTVASALAPGQRKWDTPAFQSPGLNLVLSTQDAERVAFCLENGSLYACLSRGTTDRLPGSGTTLETILGPGLYVPRGQK